MSDRLNILNREGFPGLLLTSTDKSAHNFRVHNQLFFALCLNYPKEALGVLIEHPHNLNAQDWQNFQNFLSQHTKRFGDFTLKILGTNELINLFLQKVHAPTNIRVQPTTYDETLDVIFLPKENRLLVAPLEQTASPIAHNLIKTRKKTRVMIIDDSTTIRALLGRILAQDPECEVVSSIGNPLEAEALIKKNKPDVITLDIHMPEMDGVTLLKQVLIHYKIPVIMISSISLDESSLVLDALAAGAVDYIQKPTLDRLAEVAPLILEKIKNTADAQVKLPYGQLRLQKTTANIKPLDSEYLIAIGASTGGTEAIIDVLSGLGEQIPPILIVQHIPPIFSKAFAERANRLSPFLVAEAKNGERIEPGKVLIAPGGFHMKVFRAARELTIRIEDATSSKARHKPSVDVLFESIATLKRKKVIGVILTGMGSDGAQGLLSLRKSGATTIAQDEQSCVVFGMPKEAIRLGAAEKVCPLSEIAGAIAYAARAKRTANAS